MPSIVWTPQAIQNVQERYAFLFDKDVNAASNMASLVLEHVQKLENLPQMGRPSYDLEPEHRELLIPFGMSGYILLYEVLKDTILVLAFRHQKEVGY